MKCFILTLSVVLAAFCSNAQTSYTYAPVSDTIKLSSWDDAMNMTFGRLPKNHFPSGYLLNKANFLDKFNEANGSLSDSSFNMLEWYFLQNIVRSAYYRPDSIIGYPKIDSLKNAYIAKNNILPWGLIDMTAHTIMGTAFVAGAITVSDKRLVESDPEPSNIYMTKKLFCVCPLNLEVSTLNPQFIIRPENVFSNNSKAIALMQVDLDDGSGYRDVYTEVPFQASYSDAGFKKLISRFIYVNGDTLYSRSELEVIDPSALFRAASGFRHFDELYSIGNSGTRSNPSQTLGDWPPEFSTPHDLNAVAEVGVWFSCNNTDQKVRKPLVIFGGYNPTNGKSLSANGNAAWVNDAFGALLAIAGWRGPLYETYNGFYTDASKDGDGGSGSHSFGDNGNKFFDKVRQEGYDVLIVRFHDGIGYLQNNAFLASLVLKEINDRMLSGADNVFNPGAAPDPEAPGYPNTTVLKKAKHELVVGGYSAGALSSRMALLLMEYEHEKYKCSHSNQSSKSKVHRTKTWLAFDCENQGSNTPIGEQMFMDFQKSVWHLPANMADVVNSLICRSALDLLNHNGVATQNTLYHVSNMQHTGGDDWSVGHHNDFNVYFNELGSITPANYPANLKGYPKNCYRIGVSQGSANGIGQLISSDIKLVNNESPTDWCFNPAGTTFGSVVNLGMQTTPYRDAKARVITSWNDNAFTCRLGLSIKTIFYSWHINMVHWKYHNNNHITDADLGGYQNYDEAPASTLPSHIILGSKLPLSFRNLTLAAFAFCNSVDWNEHQHGFSPTVSGLDLHQPGNNTLPRYPDLGLVPGNVSGALNMMQQNNYGNTFENSPHNDFGFPHLMYPNNHYDYTPFDAVWAHGDNISPTLYDDNTIHVEDPTPYTGEFLVEEIAPTTLYLSNRTIQGDQYQCSGNTIIEKYYADFEARNSVLVGNQSIYQHDPNPLNWYKRQRTAPGDFVIDNNAVVTIRANNDDGASAVVLGAGFSAKAGSIFRAYVFNDPNMCGPFNLSARAANKNTQPETPVNVSRPVITSKRAATQSKVFSEKEAGLMPVIDVYPNPTSGSLYYSINKNVDFKYYLSDIAGRELESGTFAESQGMLDLSKYKAGVYFITVISDQIKQTNRIIVQ